MGVTFSAAPRADPVGSRVQTEELEGPLDVREGCSIQSGWLRAGRHEAD